MTEIGRIDALECFVDSHGFDCVKVPLVADKHEYVILYLQDYIRVSKEDIDLPFYLMKNNGKELVCFKIKDAKPGTRKRDASRRLDRFILGLPLKTRHGIHYINGDITDLRQSNMLICNRAAGRNMTTEKEDTTKATNKEALDQSSNRVSIPATATDG
jgi:hypothetical protein